MSKIDEYKNLKRSAQRACELATFARDRRVFLDLEITNARYGGFIVRTWPEDVKEEFIAVIERNVADLLEMTEKSFRDRARLILHEAKEEAKEIIREIDDD